MSRTAGLLRHVEAVRNVALPAEFTPFRLGDHPVGWVSETAGTQLLDNGCRWAEGAVVLDQPDALAGLAARLAAEGAFPHRREDFDVRAEPGGPVLTRVDRGALPFFGIAAEGVHVNGLVETADGLHVWVGRRAMDRLLDPGKLDHLVAGGIPAGMTPETTLIKEGEEEASLDESVMQGARFASIVTYTMRRQEGLRRDRLHCYDLVLPADMVPHPRDGEVVGFDLWPVERVIATVRDSDDFKFNVNLVLIDLFLRRGLLAEAEAETLRAALYG